MSTFDELLEAAGLGPVAGADEAGRGACAGPLVAAAVILDPGRMIAGLNDSKALSAAQRERLYPLILDRAVAVHWVAVAPDECDRLGIQAANLMALREAVRGLARRPGFVITDGFHVDGLGVPNLGMWKGDRVARPVSAASIVAKVVRDHLMDDLDSVYPEYEFGKHKGYATALHQAHLDRLGPSPVHRMSYGNVARTSKVDVL